jgi:hypothetical protein
MDDGKGGLLPGGKPSFFLFYPGENLSTSDHEILTQDSIDNPA